MSRLAQRVINHAASVMPEHRRDWADAMRAEFHALPNGREAMTWALGCVWASYCERIQPMQLFLKSLLRAAAVWLVLLASVGVLFLLFSHKGDVPSAWYVARVLAEFYGGIFVILWMCELLIARYWTAPGKTLRNTLVRTAALWLGPVGFSIYNFVAIVTDAHIYQMISSRSEHWIQNWLIDGLTHFPLFFFATFVPLLGCEVLIARYWRKRTA